MKPILKWAGGKRSLLKEIQDRIPNNYCTYFEPFFGGGAVFFGSEIENSVVNDKNVELINFYIQVRDNLQDLIPFLDELEVNHNEEEYYKLRKIFNDRKTTLKRLGVYDAALMLYLNKAGFNGMYRENKNGLFNIPSGKRKKIKLYDKKNLCEISNRLKMTKIINADFEEAVKTAKEGDFVYFDSPYHKTFTDYQSNGFSEEEQKRLANLCKELDKRKVKFLLSNSDTEFIKELYSEFVIEEIKVVRMIRFKGKKGADTELLIRNYDL